MAVQTGQVENGSTVLSNLVSSPGHSEKPDPALSQGGCPSPLHWKEVLASYRRESASWTVARDDSVVRGRTFGKGPPIYFLNGIAGDQELFALLLWTLRDDFRCVTFDYRMRADGTRRRPLTAASLAADLFAVADSAGDERFALFATSFGGLVALTAAALFPDRIDRLVLQGAFAFRHLTGFERLMIRTASALPGSLSHVPFRVAIQTASHARCFPPFDEGRWEFFLETTGRTPLRDLADRAAIVRTFDFRPRLAEIVRPVLLIRSENEGLVSARCREELARGLPNAATETLHSTGHLAYLTHPHRLATCLRTFLSETGPLLQTSEASHARAPSAGHELRT